MRQSIFSIFVAILFFIVRTEFSPVAGAADTRLDQSFRYQTRLFGKRYRLDDRYGLSAYIKALEAEIERSKKEEALGEAHENDPVHHKEPKRFINKNLRRSMEEARAVALELLTTTDDDRDRLLNELLIIAGAIRGSFMRVAPNNMEALAAIFKINRLMYPPVGINRSGIATNLAGRGAHPHQLDPVLPSSYWTEPVDIAARDLYHGFDRDSIPNLARVICTYRRSKQSRGVYGGFDVNCDEYGKIRLKFGEVFSQPVGHRIFWALGYNTIPVDCAPIVKVKWDRRIFTEFNTRKSESTKIMLLGIPVYIGHLQHYLDPLSPVSEVIMLDEQGNEISVRPDPDWNEFKKKLYKNPKGRPETVKDNFNDSFEGRIQYVIYRNVNFRIDEDDAFGTNLGNWDWNGEGNPGFRENRGFAFVSAWLNQFDAWHHNNKLYMTKADGRRTFKHFVTDLGGCLGSAHCSLRVEADSPNSFPWTFTREAKPGTSAIPLNGSFHSIHECYPFKHADINDARWIARYMAQITGKQVLEALVASGMPSAKVRLYYNKLVRRRNKAMSDLGLDVPPIKLMDEDMKFNYDPRTQGLISIVTTRKQTVTAPDDGWIVVKGRARIRKN